jgi:hypothetical protein
MRRTAKAVCKTSRDCPFRLIHCSRGVKGLDRIPVLCDFTVSDTVESVETGMDTFAATRREGDAAFCQQAINLVVFDLKITAFCRFHC